MRPRRALPAMFSLGGRPGRPGRNPRGVPRTALHLRCVHACRREEQPGALTRRVRGRQLSTTGLRHHPAHVGPFLWLVSSGCPQPRAGRSAADQEHRRVIVQRVADVAGDVVTETIQCGVQVLAVQQGAASVEWVELP